MAPQGLPADVVRTPEHDDFTAYAEETTHESVVPTAPVDPVVKEVSLTPSTATRREGGGDAGGSRRRDP